MFSLLKIKNSKFALVVVIFLVRAGLVQAPMFCGEIDMAILLDKAFEIDFVKQTQSYMQQMQLVKKSSNLGVREKNQQIMHGNAAWAAYMLSVLNRNYPQCSEETKEPLKSLCSFFSKCNMSNLNDMIDVELVFTGITKCVTGLLIVLGEKAGSDDNMRHIYTFIKGAWGRKRTFLEALRERLLQENTINTSVKNQ